MPVYWPNGTLTMPTVTSEFNRARKNPVTGIVQPHNGIDLVGWADVCSPVDGTVLFAGYNGGYGNEVRIRADGPTAFHVGDVFRLAHHASLYVKTGQRVAAKQPVGRMGTTGNSTGVHSHFECHEYGFGNPVNPRDFMSRANTGSASGGSSTPGEWDEMATRDEIKAAVAEALAETRYGVGGRNLFDLGNDARGYASRAATAAEVSTPDKIWTHALPAQNGKGLPLIENGKPVMYTAQGYLASIASLAGVNVAEVDEAALAKALAPLLTANLAALTDADVQRIAKAAADEQARRLAS